MRWYDFFRLSFSFCLLPIVGNYFGIVLSHSLAPKNCLIAVSYYLQDLSFLRSLLFFGLVAKIVTQLVAARNGLITFSSHLQDLMFVHSLLLFDTVISERIGTNLSGNRQR
jgi:hypothetical protein